MNVNDKIWVDSNGRCTVMGDAAHKLWNYGKGPFVRAQQRLNRFFIYEGEVMRAASEKQDSVMPYYAPGRVLVSIED